MVKRLIPKISPRSPKEEHRAATPLELFFDLVFVAAIAIAAKQLHHAVVDHHLMEGVISFLLVFFAIWWAWMNFTWFSSAYDNDDTTNKLLVFLQMTGALVLASGVEEAFKNQTIYTMVIGYIIMRAALIFQWVRVALHDLPRRTTAIRYVTGIALVQIGWVLLLVFAEQSYVRPLALIGIFLELFIPAWAEMKAPTPWHSKHIIERYGLFTIIVLGESIIAATAAIHQRFTYDWYNPDLFFITLGGLLTVYSLWWIYFNQPEKNYLTSNKAGFIWGYGHYVIFCSIAAVGAGIAALVDLAVHDGASYHLADLLIAVSLCFFLLGLLVVNIAHKKINIRIITLAFVMMGLILVSTFVDHSLFAMGVILALGSACSEYLRDK